MLADVAAERGRVLSLPVGEESERLRDVARREVGVVRNQITLYKALGYDVEPLTQMHHRLTALLQPPSPQEPPAAAVASSAPPLAPAPPTISILVQDEDMLTAEDVVALLQKEATTKADGRDVIVCFMALSEAKKVGHVRWVCCCGVAAADVFIQEGKEIEKDIGKETDGDDGGGCNTHHLLDVPSCSDDAFLPLTAETVLGWNDATTVHCVVEVPNRSIRKCACPKIV